MRFKIKKLQMNKFKSCKYFTIIPFLKLKNLNFSDKIILKFMIRLNSVLYNKNLNTITNIYLICLI